MNDEGPILAAGLLALRERPAMYLSPISLTTLRHYLDGYAQGLSHGLSLVDGPLASEVKGLYDLPRDFHDWVAYRLHFEYSCAGWNKMIIERFGDGPKALDQFFRLLDEHSVRKPKFVATIAGGSGTYARHHKSSTERLSCPTKFEFFSYNDEDPGLFAAYTDDIEWPHPKRFYSNFESYESSVGGSSASAPVIYDQAAYDRWVSAVYP